MTIGSRLRRARERKNLSQLEVSKRTNINNRTLSRYENDGAEPDFNSLKVLANLYEVPISFFFDEYRDEQFDLEELLKNKKLTWGSEELNDDEKKRAIEILTILLNKQKDTN